ncbi:MAG: ribosome biogenesis GTP-binding protein YihA/YsxC [Flavobacteriales bacterium]
MPSSLLRVSFLASYAKLSQLPKPNKPEYAFVGRSNVGKSSLLNYLAARKGIAKVSGTPGKTITFNYFNVDDDWFLVDLPGYGYAKRSRTLREEWEKNLRNYLLKRENLMCVFLLIDIRIKAQKSDVEMMEWMATHNVPFVVVFTKSDKLKKPEVPRNVAAYKKHLQESWEELPKMIITSSEKQTGGEEIIKLIEDTNQKFEPS